MILQLAAIGIAMLVGILIGFVLPSFIQLYQISQYAYAKGYESGKYVVGALVRRSLQALECTHLKGAGGACRGCVREARSHLEKISVDL